MEGGLFRGEQGGDVAAQRGEGRAGVVGAHERLADEDGVRALSAKASQRVGIAQATLGHADDPFRQMGEHTRCPRYIHLERAKVAVVDTDHPRPIPVDAVEVVRVVDFEQYINAVGVCGGLKVV